MLYYIVYSNLTNKKNTIKTNYPDTYDFLKIRCTLDNVTVYPTSKVYYQIQTKVLSTFSGGNEIIYLGGSEYLQ